MCGTDVLIINVNLKKMHSLKARDLLYLAFVVPYRTMESRGWEV